MWLLALAIGVGIWAAYIAYIVTKAGGYPPYQDSVNDYNIKLGPEPDDTWPFPKDKP